MWKAIGKAIGKGVGWLIRHPDALQVVIDTVTAAKRKREAGPTTDDRPGSPNG